MGTFVELPLSRKGSPLAWTDAASLCGTLVQAVVRIRQLSSNEDSHADAEVPVLEMAFPLSRPLFIYFLMRRTQKWACSFYEGAALMAEAIKGKNSLVEQKLIREEREALKSVALKNILTAVI